MRSCCLLLGLAVAVGLAGDAGAGPSAGNAKADDIARLIDQLGSASFPEREAGSERLDAIGAPALEALHKATKSADAEVRRRAGDLVERIGRRVESEKALAPKRVRLK